MKVLWFVLIVAAMLWLLKWEGSSSYQRVPFEPPGPVVNNAGQWYERSQIRDVIERQVAARNFSRLQAMVTEVRIDKPQFTTTVPVLQDLYNGMAFALPDFPAIHEFINAWRAHDPVSNVPDILAARAHLAQAWEIRGSGYRSYVSDEQFDGFETYLQKAWEAAEQATDKGPLDAELCTVRTELMFILFKSKSKAKAQFHHCLSIDPGYIPLYAKMRVYLQRIWFGSDFELKRFIEQAATDTQTIYGDGMHAMLVSNHTFFTGQVFKPAGGSYSWPRVKAGFEDLFKIFGQSRHVLHQYGYCAMLAEDYPTFAWILQQLGTEWDEEKEFYFKKKSWYEFHLKRTREYL